jgi:hypothetical protein
MENEVEASTGHRKTSSGQGFYPEEVRGNKKPLLKEEVCKVQHPSHLPE